MSIQEVKTGLKVIYYPIIKRNGEKIGKQETIITSEAWEAGGEIFCKVKGVSGSVSIKHLERIKHGKS